ncbi:MULTISPECIES: hypothetical protein [unclassified Microcoleus]|nr:MULTISPECIES: hypothetical protein [unclassified Microcoleus]
MTNDVRSLNTIYQRLDRRADRIQQGDRLRRQVARHQHSSTKT